MLQDLMAKVEISSKSSTDTSTKEKNYPLHKAIRYRNITKIKKLATPANINEKNVLGYPPLVYACEQENNDGMLEILFEQNNINPYETENSDKQNALHILAFKGQLKWVKKFFEKFPQVHVDIVTGKGDTALILAAKMDHVDVIEYLHSKGANVNHLNDKKFTALHYAANNGYTLSTERLIELNANINALDDYGYTPLIKAASWGFTETCQILIKKGAKVNPISDQSALLMAVRRGHLDVVKLLLDSGADPNSLLKLEYASYSPLGTACFTKSLDAMKLLIQNGADVNLPGPYSIALFACIKSGFEEGLKELIRVGVCLDGRQPYSKRSPLEAAKKGPNPAIIKILQDHIPRGSRFNVRK